MDLNALFDQLLRQKLGNDFEEKVMQELSKTDPAKPEELISALTEQYRVLLSLLKVSTPCTVKLSADDTGSLEADGKVYDLDACFSSRNRKAVECRNAIEALFSDLRAISADMDQAIDCIEKRLETESA